MSESVSSIESAGDLLAIVAKQQEEIVKLRREQEMFRSRLEGKLDTMMNQQAANVKDLVKQQGTCTAYYYILIATLCAIPYNRFRMQVFFR